MECGVRQGGLSSPLLFCLYVDALLEQLGGTHVGYHVDGVCLNNISYADDMVLLAPSIAALRNLVAVCESYASSHGLHTAWREKDCTACPTERHRPGFKYLGHIVTDDLKDDADMERERKALCVKANILARRFARCSNAVKITLFKAYCSSFYTSSLCCGSDIPKSHTMHLGC
ncbi:uncharacterized protein [Choristoneura fumiferana]|uniref:uncharacterized protein n=1 Tax=Choristoneura fumiferana TaxID=7141 RepID=UPI003D153927